MAHMVVKLSSMGVCLTPVVYNAQNQLFLHNHS